MTGTESGGAFVARGGRLPGESLASVTSPEPFPMRRMLLPALLAFALTAGTAAAQEFSSLEERMSAKEFREAGLDKLTPEELARLNAWLAGRMQAQAQAAAPVAPAVPDDRRGFRDNDEDGDDIVSSIAGTFRGWSKLGDRFVLTNGQVWEVTDAPTKFSVNVENPTVRIEPGVFSAWYLSIDGYNSRVKVKRIR